MKRALLIAGGTVGGLGAVLAVTPPQFTSSESSLALGGTSAALGGGSTTQTTTPTSTTSQTPTKATPTATAKATAKATSAATTKATPSKSANSTTTQSATPTATTSPTPAASKTTTSSKSITGTFTGDVINVGYGNVQVQITVANGKITDAAALQAPSGRNQRWTDMAVPTLRQKTLAAQSANITGVSGASYTSYGWWKSLQSALSKAGL